ncbi:MAG: hypothetical protein RBT68_00570 [Spirochaetia bacterium]|nr:hypothetical protein [Spirochaetia bacterium]
MISRNLESGSASCSVPAEGVPESSDAPDQAKAGTGTTNTGLPHRLLSGFPMMDDAISTTIFVRSDGSPWLRPGMDVKTPPRKWATKVLQCSPFSRALAATALVASFVHRGKADSRNTSAWKASKPVSARKGRPETSSPGPNPGPERERK